MWRSTGSEALAKLLEQRIGIDGFTFDLPIVIGFADSDGGSIREELIDQAAAALAAAQGRHAKVGYAELAAPTDDSFEDLVLMRDLPRAMAGDELELHYQPKLRSRTNIVDSAEALLRWTHPERGAVPTDRLIELAENTGAIRDLSEWVIERAVADQRRFAAAGHDIVVYVNVSGVLLPDRDFAARAMALVAGVPGRIGFEITETAVIDDPGRRPRQSGRVRRGRHQDRDRRLRVGPVEPRLSETASRQRVEDRPPVRIGADQEPPRPVAGAVFDRPCPCAGNGSHRRGRR